MKIIDLLNRIANGDDVPTRIRLLESTKYSYYYNDIDKCYTRRAGKDYFVDLGIEWDIVSMLNDEVEILDDEEKGLPEKLNLDTDELRGKETPRAIDYLIESKINEIIDYLEKQSKGE